MSPPDLRADCSRCVGLCCVVPAFVASADFAITKPAEHACPHLQDDSRCEIHAELRPRGFAGCTAFDCFGAGQKVTQVTFGGQDWRSSPEIARPMFAVFPVVRGLQELLWYLTHALTFTTAEPLRGTIATAAGRIEVLTGAPAEVLLAVDAEEHRRAVDPLLVEASARARAAVRAAPLRRRGADLLGADLRRADLRAADLRGALLIGARLQGADLRSADLIGADLRGADLSGADLTGSLFLTQPQAGAARGDGTTLLPAGLTTPTHWLVPRREPGRGGAPSRSAPTATGPAQGVRRARRA